MLSLNQLCNGLKKISFFLFFLPIIGLLGSLLFNNILVEFNFKPGKSYKNIELYKLDKNENLTIECNEGNNFCQEIILNPLKTLNTCHENFLDRTFFIEGKNYSVDDYFNNFFIRNNDLPEILTKYKSIKINQIITKSDLPRKDCIKNSVLAKPYYFFSQPFEFLYKVKINEKFSAATSSAVYPFLYGETSISNIVKRFPINYLFKPLLFISSIVMLIYWYIYQKIFNIITDQKTIYLFTSLGFLSGIFLFLHVLFLGMDINNEYFSTIRKIIISLFILFELSAQFFLVKKIISIRNLLEPLTKRNIINLKVIFVRTIIILTIIIITVLAITNLSKESDYFLEWNYFLILLFFYLLSSLMWKKN